MLAELPHAHSPVKNHKNRPVFRRKRFSVALVANFSLPTPSLVILTWPRSSEEIFVISALPATLYNKTYGSEEPLWKTEPTSRDTETTTGDRNYRTPVPFPKPHSISHPGQGNSHITAKDSSYTESIPRSVKKIHQKGRRNYASSTNGWRIGYAPATVNLRLAQTNGTNSQPSHCRAYRQPTQTP